MNVPSTLILFALVFFVMVVLPVWMLGSGMRRLVGGRKGGVARFIGGVFLLLPMVMAICGYLWWNSDATIEIANDFTVDGQKDFPLKQPIGRTHTWMGLILETTNDLAAAPSWNTAMTPEGMHVAIVGILVDVNGTEYRSSTIVQGHNGLELRFVPLPKWRVPIKKVILATDHPVSVKRLVWEEFNYL